MSSGPPWGGPATSHTGCRITQSGAELVTSGLLRPRRASPALGRRWVCRPKFPSHLVLKGTPAPPLGKPRVMRPGAEDRPSWPPSLTLGRTCSWGLADPAGTHHNSTPPRRGPSLPQPSRLARPLPPNSGLPAVQTKPGHLPLLPVPPETPPILNSRELCGEPPGGPVVRNPSFRCKGHGFDPWSGN